MKMTPEFLDAHTESSLQNFSTKSANLVLEISKGIRESQKRDRYKFKKVYKLNITHLL